MRGLLTLVSLVIGCGYLHAQVITTVAGNGSPGFTGMGAPATGAHLVPHAVCVDKLGNIYITARDNGRICKVDTAGNIFSVAGGGSTPGDGGPATLASIGAPNFAFVDNHGNLYITQEENVIRKVDGVTSIITTIAGNGTGGFSGDGGPATAATIYDAYGIIVDDTGTIFFADAYNNRIRKIDTFGIITTVAGVGPVGLPGGSFGGDGGLATAAHLSDPCDMHFDREGNMYITDVANNRIRKIDVSGTITTVAGTGSGTFGGDGGAAISATLNVPFSLTVNGCGDIFISDAENYCIRKIDQSGIITTIAGIGGLAGYGGDGGAATAAILQHPAGICLDNRGGLLIADDFSDRLRKVSNADSTPNAGTITGADSLCPGFSTTLIDTASGGAWSSSNTTISSIVSGGVVTAGAPGHDTITYTVSVGGCSVKATRTFRVLSSLLCAEGIGENPVQKIDGVDIFPNPAIGGQFQILINSGSDETASIEIANLLGERVNWVSTATNKITTIDLSVPAGVYLVNIATKSQRWNKRVMLN